MDTKWLEDFLSLAETRSFSRSAQLRRITQPAFSRRIQALEAWAGVDLVDRSSFPTRLTAAGEAVHGQAIEILSALQYTMNLLERHASDAGDVVAFATCPAVASGVLPAWLAERAAAGCTARTRVAVTTEHDALLRLSEGAVDFVVAWHHSSQPIRAGADRFDFRVLARRRFVAACAASSPWAHGFSLEADPGLPLLTYSTGTQLGNLVDRVVRAAADRPTCRVVHEGETVEGLAVLAERGCGIAFLPEDLLQRTPGLVRAGAADGVDLGVEVEVRLYREQRDAQRRPKPVAETFWNAL